MCDENETPKTMFSLNERKPEAKILVIYTGGTIGMIPDKDTQDLVPKSGMFEKAVREFKDLNDKNYATCRFGPNSKYLCLPCSPEKYRIVYFILEYEPLLDSCNMNSENWKQIADDVKKNYEEYDAFVILHGTDTLAYTAAALSFMFENLGKSVIVTGAQISVFCSRSDGRKNFISSLIVAANYQIPEVTVLFQDSLMRGNRVNKVSSTKFHAFQSLKVPPLASLGVTIDVDWKSVFRPFGIQKFNVHTSFCNDVGLIRLHPNINAEMVRACLQPPIKGVILETYGAGNMPSNRSEIIEELRAAINAGILIVNITQCLDGSVATIYETGSVLANIGVIGGSDMTSEAAYVKLCYVLSKDEWDYEKKSEMMRRNLRGELTVTNVRNDDNNIINTIAQMLGYTTPREINELKTWLEPSLLFKSVISNDRLALNSLRKSDCNLSATDHDGKTSLHIACARNRLDIVRYLLEYGANVHIKDKFDRTPLIEAIENGNSDVIRLLIQCGAHLNMCSAALGEALCMSATYGNLTRLKHYALAGADLDTPDISGRTPLYLACLHGHADVVNYLVKAGCSPYSFDKLGITPMDIAKKMNMTLPFSNNIL